MSKKNSLNKPNEQYFSAQPSTEDERKNITVSLRGTDYEVTVSRSVFSTHRLDLGTKVLLDRIPSPDYLGDTDAQHTPHILDIGCGWGPISIAAAAEAPQNAVVWALDVNERAVELTDLNAKRAGYANVRAGTAESFAASYAQEWSNVTFDLMWSNPPIRVGKNDLHTLLLTYLPRLTVGGHAFMVVQKHLGADSLMSWLDENLNATESTGTSTGTSTATEERPAFAVSKFASAKGYRIIEVERLH